jgi:triosephosphate isomerase
MFLCNPIWTGSKNKKIYFKFFFYSTTLLELKEAEMSHRRAIAAANWKLNKSLKETVEFAEQLHPNIPPDLKCEIIIAPTFLALSTLAAKIKGMPISIAGQNCYSQNSGAFTGEVSPQFLRDAGASHAILGHSERRTIFKESDADIQKKMTAVLNERLIPIFCVGETLEEREKGQVEQVLERQVVNGLKGIQANPENLIVAYEPVWAIGTGKVAKSSDAQEAHLFIRGLLRKLYGDGSANGIRILYGGSVKPDNVTELISQPDIDGGLIGGASLKVADFAEIIRLIHQAG